MEARSKLGVQLCGQAVHSCPELLRGAAVQAYVRRWTALLAVAVQRSSAAASAARGQRVDGAEPPVSDLLADARWAEGLAPSRLPAPLLAVGREEKKEDKGKKEYWRRPPPQPARTRQG